MHQASCSNTVRREQIQSLPLHLPFPQRLTQDRTHGGQEDPPRRPSGVVTERVAKRYPSEIRQEG